MLTFPIKKQWFDMILSGEKKEEYRDMTAYYRVRFQNLWEGSLIGGKAEREIRLRNGYGKDAPSAIATVTISCGTGRPEWGAAPGAYYYRLHIKNVKMEGGGEDG